MRGVNVHAPVESGLHPTHEAGQALEERVLPRTRDGLRSIGGTKLAKDIGDMLPRRRVRDHERLGNVLVRCTLRQQL